MTPVPCTNPSSFKTAWETSSTRVLFICDQVVCWAYPTRAFTNQRAENKTTRKRWVYPTRTCRTRCHFFSCWYLLPVERRWLRCRMFWASLPPHTTYQGRHSGTSHQRMLCLPTTSRSLSWCAPPDFHHSSIKPESDYWSRVVEWFAKCQLAVVLC